MPIRRISPALVDEICGHKAMRSLSVLNLSHNEISTIENLERLGALTKLDLSYNRITEISGLDSLSRLIHISLSANRLRELAGVEVLRGLEVLLADQNEIEDVGSLSTLSWLPALHTLSLSGNPLAARSDYRALVRCARRWLPNHQLGPSAPTSCRVSSLAGGVAQPLAPPARRPPAGALAGARRRRRARLAPAPSCRGHRHLQHERAHGSDVR